MPLTTDAAPPRASITVRQPLTDVIEKSRLVPDCVHSTSRTLPFAPHCTPAGVLCPFSPRLIPSLWILFFGAGFFPSAGSVMGRGRPVHSCHTSTDSGRMMQKQHPAFSNDSTHIRPSCASITRLLMVRPTPVPCMMELARWNRPRIFSSPGQAGAGRNAARHDTQHGIHSPA